MLPPREEVKSEEQIFSDKWHELHQTSWLFPEYFEGTTPHSSDYLEAFARKQGLFQANRCPLNYTWAFTEQHKDKIVFSSHLILENNLLNYTVFQFAPNLHVIGDWAWQGEIKDFVLHLNIFYQKHADYTKVITENRHLQFFPKEESFGFKGGHHQNQV